MQRKTAELKQIQGTLEASRAEIEPVEYEELERVPKSPDGWPLEAQVVWRDFWNVLKRAGWMNRGVVSAARALCWAVYRRQLAEEKLIIDPESTFWEKVMDTNTKAVERLSAKFGMTPADLWRVPQAKRKEDGTQNLLK